VAEHEISDILSKFNGKIYDFPENTEGALVFTGVIIALMELYDFNEQDFIRLWEGEIEIEHPVNRLAKA